jgi:hypothetical protein
VGDEFCAREAGKLVLGDGGHRICQRPAGRRCGGSTGWWPRVSSGVWGREWVFFGFFLV